MGFENEFDEAQTIAMKSETNIFSLVYAQRLQKVKVK